MEEDSSFVRKTPFRTTKILATVASATLPATFKRIASSNPFAAASREANTEFRYWPQAFAVVGIIRRSNFIHEEVMARMPEAFNGLVEFERSGTVRIATSLGQAEEIPRLFVPR